MLSFLIHYEWQIQLSYRKFSSLRLNNAGIGRDDWVLAEQIYDLLGGEKLDYAHNIPDFTAQYFGMITPYIEKRTGIETENVGIINVAKELHNLYNTIKTVREVPPA